MIRNSGDEFTRFYATEQAVGERGKMGPPSDVYSLGGILYYAFTGQAPFVAGRVAETLHQLRNTEPIAPRLLAASVPVGLETICLKCLKKEPGKRFRRPKHWRKNSADFLGRIDPGLWPK